MTLKVLALIIRQEGGGAERSVQRVAQAMIGSDVELVPVALDPPRDGEMPDRGLALSARGQGLWKASLSSVRRLRSILAEGDVEVLHLHCERPELIGLLSLVVCRNRPVVVVTEHSSTQWARAPRLGKVVRRGLTAFGATFVKCHSVDPESSAISIFNPIEADLDTIPVVEEGAIARLLVLGRLTSGKRVSSILRAAEAAGWRGQIVVVGEGPERAQCEELAARIGLDVEFTGYLDDPWVIVRPGDLLVSASAFEGEPLALLEAAGRGVPMVLSDIAAHRALFGRSGSYFDSVESLAILLTGMLNTSSSRFLVPDSVRERLLREREPVHVAGLWRRLYLDLVSSPGQTSIRPRGVAR